MPEQQNQKPSLKRREELQSLVESCSEFLKADIPEDNIIPESEFSKFLPLFNNQLFSKLSDDKVHELCDEYNNRFSTRHPIKIIASREATADDETIVKDRQRYVVVATIPPLFRSIRTLNEVGAKLPNLIVALYNASQRNTPVDNSMQKFSSYIGQALQIGGNMDNPDQERAKFNEMEKKLIGGKAEGPSDKTSQDEDNVMSDSIDW